MLDLRQKLQIKLLRQQLQCQVFIAEPHLPDQSQATRTRRADACCYEQIAVSVLARLTNCKLHPNPSVPWGNPPHTPSPALTYLAPSGGVCRGTAGQQKSSQRFCRAAVRAAKHAGHPVPGRAGTGHFRRGMVPSPCVVLGQCGRKLRVSKSTAKEPLTSAATKDHTWHFSVLICTC